MYCVATLHPDLVEARHPDYHGGFFTEREKRRLIRKFYKQKLEIPLCIDHCGAQTCGFVVPDSERIGHVVDLFNGRDGQLMVKMKLDNRHPAYARINRGMEIYKELWGVSVWIDFYNTGRKELTHVALTTDPLFASQGTWIHARGLEERLMDEVIAKHFYKHGDKHCYATPEFEKRLSECHLTPRQHRAMSHNQQQHQKLAAQQPQQQTLVEEDYEDDEAYDSMDEQEEMLQQEGSAAGQEMQTEEPVVAQPAPPTTQELPLNQTQKQSTPAPTGDNNQRPLKRRRAHDGAPVATAVPAQARGQAQKTTSLEPVKEGDKIDFEDFMEVKRQYDLYSNHITLSEVPFHLMNPAFKKAFNKLDEKMTEYKQVAMDYLDSIEKAKYLKPDIAREFREAVSDHNQNARSQECMLGFVAATRSFFESNVADIRLENNTLREKVRLLEENRQAQAQQRARATQPQGQQQRTPKQGRSTGAATSNNQQRQQYNSYENSRPLPPQYAAWTDVDGSDQLSERTSKMSPGQLKLQSCFNDMFSRQWGASGDGVVSTALPLSNHSTNDSL